MVLLMYELTLLPMSSASVHSAWVQSVHLHPSAKDQSITFQPADCGACIVSVFCFLLLFSLGGMQYMQDGLNLRISNSVGEA